MWWTSIVWSGTYPINKFMCLWIWCNLKFYMVCDKLFIINQHKFLVSYFLYLVFCKTKLVANVHEKVHPLSFSIPIFIHKYHSSMTCGRIFFHVTKYFVLGVMKYYLNILSMLEEYSKKIWSYSLMLTCSCSWNNIHVYVSTFELEIL